MKDCKTFLKLQEAAGNKQAEARRQGYEGNTKKRTSSKPASNQWSDVIRLKRIYNFLCFMLVLTPFS
jgi:hypothetical protein